MKTIQDKNESIAKFMNWKKIDKDVYANPNDRGDCWSTSGMMFNSSWDWLMEVVEHIETLNNNGFDVDIFTDGTVITQYRISEVADLSNGKEVVRLTNAEIGFDEKIDHTFLAVIDFIKWNNK